MPRLISRPYTTLNASDNKLRDTLREYIRVVPQNIMHDRRIVRGNTFAALVIPLSNSAILDKFRYATTRSETGKATEN
jgi:hypothetical protein